MYIFKGATVHVFGWMYKRRWKEAATFYMVFGWGARESEVNTRAIFGSGVVPKIEWMVSPPAPVADSRSWKLGWPPSPLSSSDRWPPSKQKMGPSKFIPLLKKWWQLGMSMPQIRDHSILSYFDLKPNMLNRNPDCAIYVRRLSYIYLTRNIWRLS